MYGTFRYVLANLVVLSHLSYQVRATAWAGTYAVFGFYALSGFLMTYILNETYGFNWSGIRNYFLNRAIRIYSTYWIVLAVSLVIVTAYPETSRLLHAALTLPHNVGQWLHNLFIFGLGGTFQVDPDSVRLSPPAWALHIELLFYIAIPFLARTRMSSFVWFCASVAYAIYLKVTGGNTFYPVQAASLPFSSGALLYYFVHRTTASNSVIYSPVVAVFAVIAFAFNLFYGPAIFHGSLGIAYYLNLLIVVLIIACLFTLSRKKVPCAFGKIDKFLGDLSYPIYLIHWQVAVLVIAFFFNGIPPERLSAQRKIMFLILLPAVNAVATAVYLLCDSQVKSLRDKVRGFSVG